MKLAYTTFVFFLGFYQLIAQNFTGQIFISDRSQYFLNQVYITNLNTGETVNSDYLGRFKIAASIGDKIRYTSIITERKDMQISAKHLESPNFLVSLEGEAVQIDEVVLTYFKPTGFFAKDFYKIKDKDDKLQALNKYIGLPNAKKHEPELPKVVDFTSGIAFNLNTIYDILSGDFKRKKRLYEYEKMMQNISKINKFFGDNYFKNIKIPKKLVENFLEFVYLSDNLEILVEKQNYSAIGLSINRYKPIYLKRLNNSNLLQIIGNK